MNDNSLILNRIYIISSGLSRGDFRKFRKFSAQFIRQRDQPPAERIAQSHEQNCQQCVDAPDSGDGEIIHICDTVFKSAKDKDRHTEENGGKTENIAELFVFERFHRQIHEDTAEKGKDQDAQRRISKFFGADGRNSGIQFGEGAAVPDERSHQKTSEQVSGPDQQQGDEICADFARSSTAALGKGLVLKSLISGTH